MTLQTSGSISISDLVSEFGGSAPHSLSEYYRGGSNVPSTITTGVPAGSFGAYQYNADGFAPLGTVSAGNYLWKTQIFSIQLIWNGQTVPNLLNLNPPGIVFGPQTQTLIQSGDTFEYQRGSLIATTNINSSGFALPASLYQIRRRQTATETTTTVNTGIPSSGQVSLTDYFGGRKT